MKKQPTAPTPVDPTKVADAQTGSNIDTAIAQQDLNHTNQSNPFGSITWNQTGTQMVDGHSVPTYGMTSSLSPQLQSLLDSYMGNAQSAAGHGLDFSSGNPNLMQLQDPSLLTQKTADALYGQATSRLDPQWDKASNAYEAKLAERGIPMGSDAYSRAMDDFGRSKNDAYTSAQNSATESAVRDAGQLFGEQLAGRQQGVNEMTTGQSQPLSLLAQIMSSINGGAPQANPTQAGVSPTDVTGAYRDYQNQLQQNYQNQLQSYQSGMGGLGGLLGTAMMLPFL